MPDSPPQTSPLAWFFSSRKGLLTLFTFIVAALFAVVVVVEVFRGRMTPETGLAFCGGGILGWFVIAFKAIDAISKEDAAAKSAPTTANTGSGDIVVTNTNAPKDPTP